MSRRTSSPGQRRAPPAASSGVTTAAKGRRAEDLALQHLKRHDLELIARNYRCRAGEIDLVMEQAGIVVFVEVRSRASSAFVSPKETVDWRKQRRLARVAAWFLRSRRDLAKRPVRFDVVSVTKPNCHATLEWIQNAFQVDDSR